MKDLFLIKYPLITEKAVALHPMGKYVFMVKPNATKPEVKKAVKEIYRVDAVDVRIVNIPGKSKRFRNMRTKKAGHKKAIVTLKQGQTIDLGR